MTFEVAPLEDDRPKHFCGIVGMALEGDAVPQLKKSLRAEHGWIMDIYLLRPAGTTDAGD